MNQEIYTHPIYVSNKVKYELIKNNKKVFSTEKIKKRELLLIEHLICGSKGELKNWLSKDTRSRNMLYPFDSSKIEEKIDHNSFIYKIRNNLSILSIGIYNSFFSSSNFYNAGAFSDIIDKDIMGYIDDDFQFGGDSSF
jgi:hypothetical protein